MRQRLLNLTIEPCNKKTDVGGEKTTDMEEAGGEAEINYWIFALIGVAVLSLVIILSLIAGLVHWKNEARKETETEIRNVLYGMEYSEGSEIKEINPAYTRAHRVNSS